MAKACRQCKRVIEKGTKCQVCQSTDLTSTFQGTVLIFDVHSEIAQKLNITVPGKYAIKV